MCIEGVAVKAPAKINLFLEVLGKRPDGYHEVRSIVVPVALFDDLTFESMDAGVETKVRGSGVQPADVKRLENSTGNLATDAGLVLKEATGYPGGVRIRIEKGIPICGGLGGGSADAAATLKGLNEMWRTGLGLRELSLLGQRLGSDIPAMLQGRAVVVRGRGERVTALRLNREKRRSEDWWVVIVNPGFGASDLSCVAVDGTSLMIGLPLFFTIL